MVRLTASTSKSIFMIRSPQALLLLRLFRDCSPAPSLCHHLWNVCFLFSLCYIAQQVNIALDQSDLLWGLRRAKSFFVHHGSSLHHLSTQEPLLWSAVSFSWRIQNKNLPKVQQTQLVCWPCTAICSGLSTALLVWIPTYIPESKLSHSRLWHPSLNLIILCLNSKNLYHLMRYSCYNFHNEHTIIPVIIKGILHQKNSTPSVSYFG